MELAQLERQAVDRTDEVEEAFLGPTDAEGQSVPEHTASDEHVVKAVEFVGAAYEVATRVPADHMLANHSRTVLDQVEADLAKADQNAAVGKDIPVAAEHIPGEAEGSLDRSYQAQDRPGEGALAVVGASAVGRPDKADHERAEPGDVAGIPDTSAEQAATHVAAG